MISPEVNVVIIGAGPYGLSLAAHLAARRVDHRIFGSPMQAWLDMSAGMYLKSYAFAANIYTPRPYLKFQQYCIDRGLESVEPTEIADFARYGLLVQKQRVPQVEQTNVIRVAWQNGSFQISLESGESVRARCVVNATGLSYFERMPKELTALPSELASHTSQHGDFSPFRGRRVVVVGAGQSALQAAALLHEHGASVEMHVRGSGIYFGDKVALERPFIQRLRVPATVLGAGRENWVLQHLPMLAHHLPEEKRVHITRTWLGPYGAWWLRDRVVGKFPVHAHSQLCDARPEGGGVHLRFSRLDGEDQVVQADHVIAGTGYETDLDAIPYLDRSLASAVRRIARAPRLSRHFQTSVPGLYFVGPASALSFGPLFRFIAGAEYTSRTVLRHLERSRGRAPSKEFVAETHTLPAPDLRASQ